MRRMDSFVRSASDMSLHKKSLPSGGSFAEFNNAVNALASAAIQDDTDDNSYSSRYGKGTQEALILAYMSPRWPFWYSISLQSGVHCFFSGQSCREGERSFVSSVHTFRTDLSNGG